MKCTTALFLILRLCDVTGAFSSLVRFRRVVDTLEFGRVSSQLQPEANELLLHELADAMPYESDFASMSMSMTLSPTVAPTAAPSVSPVPSAAPTAEGCFVFHSYVYEKRGKSKDPKVDKEVAHHSLTVCTDCDSDGKIAHPDVMRRGGGFDPLIEDDDNMTTVSVRWSGRRPFSDGTFWEYGRVATFACVEDDDGEWNLELTGSSVVTDNLEKPGFYTCYTPSSSPPPEEAAPETAILANKDADFPDNHASISEFPASSTSATSSGSFLMVLFVGLLPFAM